MDILIPLLVVIIYGLFIVTIFIEERFFQKDIYHKNDKKYNFHK